MMHSEFIVNVHIELIQAAEIVFGFQLTLISATYVTLSKLKVLLN